jgi:hypothetical protein
MSYLEESSQSSKIKLIAIDGFLEGARTEATGIGEITSSSMNISTEIPEPVSELVTRQVGHR